MVDRATPLRPGAAATLVSDPPTETADQLCARLEREAATAGKLVFARLVEAAAAYEKAAQDVADRRLTLPAGVCEQASREASRLPTVIQGMETIMNRNAK